MPTERVRVPLRTRPSGDAPPLGPDGAPVASAAPTPAHLNFPTDGK